MEDTLLRAAISIRRMAGPTSDSMNEEICINCIHCYMDNNYRGRCNSKVFNGTLPFEALKNSTCQWFEERQD